MEQNMKQTELEQLVKELYHKDAKKAYEALKELQAKSLESNAVYPFLDEFGEMLLNENSYIRARGAKLIAANARWDSDYKIDEWIDEYLKHITDVKPITARQCIQALPTLIQYKPDLKETAAKALKKANTSIYPDSMRPLVEKDISQTLQKLKLHP